MNTPRDSNADQDESNSSASFAHSLAVAPLDTASTLHNITLALNNGNNINSSIPTDADTDTIMTDVTNAVQNSMAAMDQSSQQQQQPESRMAVAELLVSLAQNSRGNEGSSLQDEGVAAFVSAATGNPPTTQQSPIYRNAVDYVGSVKKAYESNPKVYTQFLSALEQYHGLTPASTDRDDSFPGSTGFASWVQGVLARITGPSKPASTTAVTQQTAQQQASSNAIFNNGHAAADFLSLIKERSQQEPDMYQHMITLLRKFQKDHSYANLYFYVSIILRYHPHLLQRFHNFLPTAVSGVEVTEPRVISKAPPEELVVSPDFIEAKDFVQTVKFEAKSDLSMYDRFIFALEKYQCNGWTLDQVYSEVSLIFWNHPDALAGFKNFISSVPPPSSQP
ncbi:hypothetical protein BGX27_008408 [Mortierella sp. AM989]|nr:hypothetical protein BGX27_008408 [Mortierella sp. AM989]